MDINDEQYLTVKELSVKIKFSQQTIYNMIHKGDFVKGIHYVKPRPKKVLFLWTAVCTWLESSEEAAIEIQKPLPKKTSNKNKTLINI